MNVPLVEAQARLPELMEQAISGEEILVEFEDGRSVQLKAVQRVPPAEAQRRRELLEALAEAGSRKATPGPCAARSQDWLYDEFGLPA